jgi:hypothetical protein
MTNLVERGISSNIEAQEMENPSASTNKNPMINKSTQVYEEESRKH